MDTKPIKSSESGGLLPKWLKITLSACALLFIFAILIPLVAHLHINHWFDYSETGQIGETIGGITSPFLGIITIILVYKSFQEQHRSIREQQEANAIARIDSDRALFMQSFDLLQRYIDKLSFTYSNATYTGNEAVKVYAFRLESLIDGAADESICFKLLRGAIDIRFVLIYIVSIVDLIQGSRLLEAEKERCLDMISNFYQNYLYIDICLARQSIVAKNPSLESVQKLKFQIDVLHSKLPLDPNLKEAAMDTELRKQFE